MCIPEYQNSSSQSVSFRGYIPYSTLGYIYYHLFSKIVAPFLDCGILFFSSLFLFVSFCPFFSALLPPFFSSLFLWQAGTGYTARKVCVCVNNTKANQTHPYLLMHVAQFDAVVRLVKKEMSPASTQNCNRSLWKPTAVWSWEKQRRVLEMCAR